MTDERRPVDLCRDSQGISAEAAELAEHIRNTQPHYKREEFFNQLIEMIDDAHELTVRAELDLEDD